MKQLFLFIALLYSYTTFAQFNPAVIKTDVVLDKKRRSFDKYLRETVIGKAFQQPLDSNSVDYYESACLAASQFMLDNDTVKAGFDTLLLHYDSLPYSTKRAFLEGAFSLYPNAYTAGMANLVNKEKEPKLFCMEAVYLYNNDPSDQNIQQLQRRVAQSFGATDTLFLLEQLKTYLNTAKLYKQKKLPDLSKLFSYRKATGVTTIYSFQRWNRDYPGLAVVQNEDGCFARDSNGHVLMLEQLARSTSNMPYFLTGGNTPQGIYSIWSTAISRNTIIGPSPNLQMLLPFENERLYWRGKFDSAKDQLRNYIGLLPIEWQNYPPILEAYNAGKGGRTEIIAHGTTIDPAYFKDKPYYPLSPTLGCLCGKEWWNGNTGKIEKSDQLNLVNTFLAQNEEETGWLYVINIDDKQQPVSSAEIEKIVDAFEMNAPTL